MTSCLNSTFHTNDIQSQIFKLNQVIDLHSESYPLLSNVFLETIDKYYNFTVYDE